MEKLFINLSGSSAIEDDSGVKVDAGIAYKYIARIGLDDPRVRVLRNLADSPEKGTTAWLEEVRGLCREIVESERPTTEKKAAPAIEVAAPGVGVWNYVGLVFWSAIFLALCWWMEWDIRFAVACFVGAFAVLTFTRLLADNLTRISEARGKITGAAWLAAKPQVQDIEVQTASLQEQTAEAVDRLDALAAGLEEKAEEEAKGEALDND